MYEIDDSHYPVSPYTTYTFSNLLIAIGTMTMILSFYLSLARAELHYIIIGTFYGTTLCFTGCALQLYFYFRNQKSQAVADIEE